LAKTCIVAGLLFTLLWTVPALSATEQLYPVGLKQTEFREGDRQLALAMFYPADVEDKSAPTFNLPFFVNLHLYKDAEIAGAGAKYPLVLFSHGRGSNPLQYAWFAETLASHGYIVAAPYHYRANTYDSTIAYLANKLWQRPRDISFDISALLNDPVWGKHIEASRIGVAGHSQGGFTSLWIGGAKVNADKYLAFQKGWKSNQAVPQYLRDELPLDPAPALDAQDERVKAAFAMHQASSKPSAWMRMGCASLPSRPISRSARATLRRRRQTMPSSPRNTFRTPSWPSSPAMWTTRFSSMNATRKGATNFPRRASTRLASIARQFTSRWAPPRSNSSTRI
jgi:hypothetical protein